MEKRQNLLQKSSMCIYYLCTKERQNSKMPVLAYSCYFSRLKYNLMSIKSFRGVSSLIFVGLLTIMTVFSASAAHFSIQTNPPPDSCPAPCGIQILSVGATQATVIWCAPPGVTTFNVVVTDSTNAVVATATVTGTSYTVTGLTPGILYNIEVCSECDNPQIAPNNAENNPPPPTTNCITTTFRTFIIIEGVVYNIVPSGNPAIVVNTNTSRLGSFSWPENCRTITFVVKNGTEVVSQFAVEVCKMPSLQVRLRKYTSFSGVSIIGSTQEIKPIEGQGLVDFKIQIISIDTKGGIDFGVTGMPMGYRVEVFF